ncbi:MAG: hypothetical protein K0R67_1263 [Paenibacillus sp.]|nr:hypothetical protein [Paenibacillus sp.]
MSESVWLVILAAGQSKRMGSPKQLLPIQGESLIRYVTKKALSVEGIHVAVVGPEGPIMKQQCADLPIAWIENKQADRGMSSSIHAGVEHAVACRARAVIIVLGDQPDLDSRVITQMVAAYLHTPSAILQARYEGQPGHPVLFDKALFADLMQLEGDSGARLLIRENSSSVQYVEVSSAVPLDLDTPLEYEEYLRSIDVRSAD